MQQQTEPQPNIESVAASRPGGFILALALFLFLLSVYLVTYSPRFHSSDGLAMFSLAESLVRRGDWDTDQIRWMGLQQGTFGLDGHLYSRKGAGVSLLEVPLAWLGLIVPAWGAATTVLLFNSLVTAATGALLLLYLRRLGYDDFTSLAAGLTFGLATLAWPYAKTCFSDPLAGLCLLGAALALLRFRDQGRALDVFWTGLALAIAVATRYANAVLIIPFFALLVVQISRQTSNVKRQEAAVSNQLSAVGGPSGRLRSQRSGNLQSLISNLQLPTSNLQPLISTLLAFGAPLAVTAAAIAVYNVVRYGNPFDTGYLPQENFGGDWLQGIAGLLVSPGRGLFLYAPVLLLALPTLPALFRRHRAEAALAWSMIAAHLLLYGKWYMWHGGYAWGPRFIIPTLPFFIIGMAPAIEWARRSAWRWRGFLALAVFSGLIQVLGLSVHFELFQNWLLGTGLPLFDPITFFDPRYSPLVGQFQFLRPENLDFAWMVAGQVDWPLLAVLVVAVLVTGWGLRQTVVRHYGRLCRVAYSVPPDERSMINHQDTKAPSSRKYGILSGLVSWWFKEGLLSAVAVLAAIGWLLVRAHALPYGDLRDAVAALNARTATADAVVTNSPEETVAFADLYKGHADVLGLNAGGPPLDRDTSLALADLVKEHPRVWWLPNWLSPEQSGVERWLLDRGFRAEDQPFNSKRLALYYFPPQPLKEFPVETTLGDTILLERAATQPTVQPGSPLPVALAWRTARPIAADYHVFVHLLNAAGERVAQSDGQPAVWTRPTSGWRVGETVEDRHGLSLPADLPPGSYSLVVGLYTPSDGVRLHAPDGADAIVLTTIEVGSKE